MISILIISHGTFAEALKETAEMVLGKQDHLSALGLKPDDSPEVLKEQIVRLLSEVPKGQEVCIFTDILSGTPFNTVVALTKEYSFAHLSGVNLPLLVEALVSRNERSAGSLTEHLMQSAPKTIIDVNKLLAGISQ